MISISKRKWTQAAIALGFALLISGCASSSTVLDGFDASSFRKRRIVVLKAVRLLPITALASNEYESFGRDGITNEQFRDRIEVAFFKELSEDASGSKVVVDTLLHDVQLTDSTIFVHDGDVIKARITHQGLDTNDLYLFFTPIMFMTNQNFIPKLSSTAATTTTMLNARMGWVIYDPRLTKAVAGGRVEVGSSTFAVLTNLITQSDWFADARKLAYQVEQEIAQIR